MDRPISTRFFRRGCQVIPGGVNSPVRAAKGLLSTPLIVDRGAGSHVWDVDGHEYIDYCMSWGALILGHVHPLVVDAAQSQLIQGSTFGIATSLEVDMAERLTELMPSLEKVRLVNSGTEATMTAIRLARAATRRQKIVKFSGHYHGHVDGLLVRAGSGAAFLNSTATSGGILPAVVQDTISLPFNDIPALETLFTSSIASQIAAVIVEPIAANMGVVPPSPTFLPLLRHLTSTVGALLIFDEVITGFRVSLQGAQGLYSLQPDLTCLGKVLGGGFPLAAIGGKKELLDLLAPLGDVYQAGTLAGHPVGVRAGLATLNHLTTPSFYNELERKGQRLAVPIQQLILERNLPACVQRVGSLMTLFLGAPEIRSDTDLQRLDPIWFARLFHWLFERGIYIPPSQNEAWFLSAVHTDAEIDRTAEAVVDFLRL